MKICISHCQWWMEMSTLLFTKSLWSPDLHNELPCSHFSPVTLKDDVMCFYARLLFLPVRGCTTSWRMFSRQLKELANNNSTFTVWPAAVMTLDSKVNLRVWISLWFTHYETDSIAHLRLREFKSGSSISYCGQKMGEQQEGSCFLIAPRL